MITRERLQRSELFADFPSELVDRVAEFAQERSYPTRSVVFHEESPAGEVYLLEEGVVGLYVTASGGSDTLANTVRTPGEPMGWERLVGQPHYSATARCMADTRAIALDGERLRDLLDQDPVAGFHLMRRLAALATARLTATRAQLRSILTDSVITAG